MALPDLYPALIASDATYTIQRATHPATRVLHVVGESLYLVCLHLPASVGSMTVFKSTNSGGSWTEKDTGNRKAVTTTAGAGTFPFGTVLSGTTIYVVHSAGLIVDQFSTATDTWGARVASGGPTGNDPDHSAGVGSRARDFIIRRSDGSSVFLYQANVTISGNPFCRARLVTWSSGAGWATPIDPSDLPDTGVSGQYDEYAAGLTLGSGDRVHVWFTNNTNIAAVGEQQLYHRTYKPNNAWGSTAQQVDPGYKLTASGTQICVGMPASLDSTIFCPYGRTLNAGGVAEMVVVIGESADTPTWGIEMPPGVDQNASGFPDYYPDYDVAASLTNLGNNNLVTASASTTKRWLSWMSGTQFADQDGAVFASVDGGNGWDEPAIGYNAYGFQTQNSLAFSDTKLAVVFRSAPSALAAEIGLFFVMVDACPCGSGGSGTTAVSGNLTIMN